MTATHSSVLSLDVGTKRIGVAVAALDVRLPRPLITLDHDDKLFSMLATLITEEDAGAIIMGYPRGLQGQHTDQTHAIEDFSAELAKHIDVPIHYQDEALTSVNAEDELKSRGKPYSRGDIDALAAMYILEDWLKEHLDLTEFSL